MSQAGRPRPAVLAVMVGLPNAPAGRAGRGTGTSVDDRQVRIVRAMLAAPGGREVGGSRGSTCVGFDDWPEALDAALALRSQLPRLPIELRGIDVRIGLDLAGTATDPAAARRAARIAASAGPNEIRLGEGLARLVEHEPRDRLVVRPLDPPAGGTAKGVHRLANARDEVPTNLVVPATSFVGRETEIAWITGLLDRQRLITLSGPPGTGKSRLATEVADRLLGRYEAGAWFVALAPILDPTLAMSTIAGVLGVPTAANVAPMDALADYLGRRRTLVVLDNFEHLITAAADLLQLLEAAPGLHLIVTSQTPLQLPGEREVAIAPLAVPPAGGKTSTEPTTVAVELFVQRAAAAQPAFRIDEGNAVQVSELVRRLDGLPLAIELAAARINVLSVAAILERLDDRLGLLSGGSSDRPVRHQSLRAAIDWSYELLDPSGQRLFRRLSIFRGGCSLEAVTAVAGEGQTDERTLNPLTSLQSAGLLLRYGPAGGSSRFEMLETLRQSAAERLVGDGESHAVARLHAGHYHHLAVRSGRQLTGPDQAAALDALAADHDNIRAALGYLLETDPLAALRMASAIWRFWQMRGHLAEGIGWVAATIEAAGSEAPSVDLANARAAAGGLAYWRGDLSETERHYTAAVDLRRTVGDDVAIADALFDLAFVYDPSLRPPPEDRDRTDAGIGIAEEAHERYVAAKYAAGIAKSEWLLGSIVAGGDIDRAKTLLASSVDRFRRLQDPFGLGWALHSYGLTLLRSIDADSAAAAFGEALGLFAAAGDGSATALLLDDFAEIAKAEGDALRAARLKGAASGMRKSTQAELAMANAPWLDADAMPRGLIDPSALERAWVEGRALSPAAATAYALGSEMSIAPEAGLRVMALGPLSVDRAGAPVSEWGGPKAGNRHALAIFAFLMDRGDRGVTKDEFVEVLWPDAEVEQGDLNFHRTLGGLRTTLARPSTSGSHESVVFANGRYRLAPAVIDWIDVGEFQQRLLNAAEATDEIAVIRGLESARSLYRGDYLDDCPLYGDSGYVEERRRFLRGRMVDALVDLGRRYELRHDESLASERYREALTVSGGDCPSATEGLERLGVAST